MAMHIWEVVIMLIAWCTERKRGSAYAWEVWLGTDCGGLYQIMKSLNFSTRGPMRAVEPANNVMMQDFAKTHL